jgi:hypothetical protein
MLRSARFLCFVQTARRVIGFPFSKMKKKPDPLFFPLFFPIVAVGILQSRVGALG